MKLIQFGKSLKFDIWEGIKEPPSNFVAFSSSKCGARPHCTECALIFDGYCLSAQSV